MSNHHVTLETAQRLKAAGFPQDTLFSHVILATNSWFIEPTENLRTETCQPYLDAGSAAPILTEVLEQLPKTFRHAPLWMARKWPSFDWFALYWDHGTSEASEAGTRHENPAEAAALLWLKLKEAEQ